MVQREKYQGEKCCDKINNNNNNNNKSPGKCKKLV
jgi:hypothetical protein